MMPEAVTYWWSHSAPLLLLVQERSLPLCPIATCQGEFVFVDVGRPLELDLRHAVAPIAQKNGAYING